MFQRDTMLHANTQVVYFNFESFINIDLAIKEGLILQDIRIGGQTDRVIRSSISKLLRNYLFL